MKKIAVILVILLMPVNAYGFDKWTTGDYVGEGLVGVSLWLDYKQTLKIINDNRYSTTEGFAYPKNGDPYYYNIKTKNYTEGNKFLGKEPSKSEVRRYFGGIFLSSILVTHLLPQELRKYLHGGIVMVQADFINHNYEMGFKIEF